MASSIAQRIAAASASGSGAFFKPGYNGIVEVVSLQAKDISTKKRPNKHLAAIAEFKIVTTNDPSIHAVGTTASIVEEIDAGAAYPEQALGRVKAMVLALAGVKESEVTAADLEAEVDSAFGDQNPRKGQQVSLESFAKLREGKDPITKLKFSPLPEAQAAVA